jgi:hypothetical protein
MQELFKYSLAIATTVFLSGCGVPIPECGDPKSLELVKKLLAEQIFAANTSSEQISQTIVDGVETISKDDKLKKNQCQATISWKLSGNAMRIVEAINEPSLEKSQALFIGVGLADDQSQQLMTLFGGKKPTQDEYEDLFYKKSLDKSTYETNQLLSLMGVQSTFGVLNKNINNLLTKGKVEVLNGDTIKLSNQKLSYSIRPNEDKNKKDTYIVELNFPRAAIEAIAGIEGLVDIENRGKAVITKMRNQPNTSSSPQPSTPSAGT